MNCMMRFTSSFNLQVSSVNASANVWIFQVWCKKTVFKKRKSDNQFYLWRESTSNVETIIFALKLNFFDENDDYCCCNQLKAASWSNCTWKKNMLRGGFRSKNERLNWCHTMKNETENLWFTLIVHVVTVKYCITFRCVGIPNMIDTHYTTTAPPMYGFFSHAQNQNCETDQWMFSRFAFLRSKWLQFDFQ